MAKRSKSSICDQWTLTNELTTFVLLVESLIHRLRKRSPRYGPNPKRTIPWESCSKNGTLGERILSLNKFLLDDTLPDGSRCTWVGTPPEFRYPTNLRKSKCEAIASVVQFAIELRRNQRLQDGNHRTSILLMFELLADAGIHCDADVVDLYILLSNGGNDASYELWTERQTQIERFLQRSTRRKVVGDEQRYHFAMNVKSLWKWSTLFEDLNKVTDIKNLRKIKRRSQKRYQQWYRLRKERDHGVK